MSCTEVNLSDLAHEIAVDLQIRAPERKTCFNISPGLVARGEPCLLKVALTNLLGNAMKYTGKVHEPRIEFGMLEHQHKRAFYVRDNGAGFDMKDYEKLFKPFQRLHGAHEFPGTGIGLMIVQRIIHRHGGEIWANAEPGKGASFFFSLLPERMTS